MSRGRRDAGEPSSPRERDETSRQTILALLEQGPCSVRDLSVGAKLQEREIYGHLEHLKRSLEGKGRKLVIVPAECLSCGFRFEKRGRFKRPGRCPVCRGESIHGPVFQAECPRGKSGKAADTGQAEGGA